MTLLDSNVGNFNVSERYKTVTVVLNEMYGE